MSTCEACAAFEASQDTESVGAADNIRFARTVLALLNGAEDAVAAVAEQVGSCPACTARFAGAGAGMCTGQMLALGLAVAAEPSMTDEEKWAAAHESAIAQMEQIVLDAADLEAGPPTD